MAAAPCFVKLNPDSAARLPMREEPAPLSREERPLTREERLAAKLRENLRRRKVQAREIAEEPPQSLPKDGPDS